MPIPLLQTEEQAAQRRAELQLVDATLSARANDLRGSLLYPRLIAHFVDACVVAGFSVYMAKFYSVLLVAVHAKAISGAGKLAGPVFREAFEYSSGQLLAASFAAISVVYFVGIPLVAGRTLGMGLLGLRIQSDSGEPVSLRQLTFRLVVCALTYVSAGFLCVFGIRKRNGRFLHDILSGSHVTRD